jgi:hypothetical protein
MGEFFYVNQIDFRSPDYLKIAARKPNGENTFQMHAGHRRPARRSLVLVSGGKDSALALHALREAGEEFNCLLLNPPPSAMVVAAIAGCTGPIIVRRTLDPRMLELNRQGYLNGHTPFSAYLAFLGLTGAVLFDYDRVVVSNERSSDEGNVRFLGAEINHQYPRPAFETAMREYTRAYLALKLVTSILRPRSNFRSAGCLLMPRILHRIQELQPRPERRFMVRALSQMPVGVHLFGAVHCAR